MKPIENLCMYMYSLMKEGVPVQDVLDRIKADMQKILDDENILRKTIMQYESGL